MIFPEGGNFTPERRQRAIDKLRRLGLEAMAAPGREDGERAGPAAGWPAGGPRRRPGGGRRTGGAHRPRPHAHRRRRVARAADGQADHHALVAGVARRDPGGPRRADRLAVLVVGADRRLGGRAPPGRPAPSISGGVDRAAWRPRASSVLRRRRSSRPGCPAWSRSCGSGGCVGRGHVGGGPARSFAALCAPPAGPEPQPAAEPASACRTTARPWWPGGRRASSRRPRRCRRARAAISTLRSAVLLLPGASTSPLRAATAALPRFLVSPRTSSVASPAAAIAAVMHRQHVGGEPVLAGGQGRPAFSRASATSGAAFSRASAISGAAFSRALSTVGAILSARSWRGRASSWSSSSASCSDALSRLVALSSARSGPDHAPLSLGIKPPLRVTPTAPWGRYLRVMGGSEDT